MKILSYNPGHDGAIVYLKKGELIFSIEAEKNSNYRYSPTSSHDVFRVLAELNEIPDVVCLGGWWQHKDDRFGPRSHVGYRGVSHSDILITKRHFLGKQIDYFSSSHERSHILCSFGTSSLSNSTPCYVLIWEGAIGAFYEIDSEMNITMLAEIMSEPGHRYSLLYGLADPTFNKQNIHSLNSAGKLMALASFSDRKPPSVEGQAVMSFLLQDSNDLGPSTYNDLKDSPYYNIGLENPDFLNLAGLFSDKIFNLFYQFAKENMKKGLPLLIGGGCGLNCDWNSKWKESGLFSEIFVPPVANDSGSALGTAIDAQLYYTGNAKIKWSVYSGLNFEINHPFDITLYDVYEFNNELVADLLLNDFILGWVNGKYEIGPRALGNRSILAAPFCTETRIRLNNIKQREQFRPIAPVCLREDAKKWFGCDCSSPYMLYTYIVNTDALCAVTHVNKTARLQTVSSESNFALYKLLLEFKKRTGYGVLCNTSLNFNGRGFINKIDDLSLYTIKHGLDGFVVEERCFLLKSSKKYEAYKQKRKGDNDTFSLFR